MRVKRWLIVPAFLLGMTSVLVARTTDSDDDTNRPPALGATADLSTAPRVGVDRPKPTFPLYERDKRVHGLKPFQDLVDAAKPGDVLRPPAGAYAGPVVLTKPLTIEGGGVVTIDSGDRGTVFSVQADGVVLRGLHLTGSGDSHDTDDSCLDVRGHRNLLENLVIDNCLFGIDLKQSNDNVLRKNKVGTRSRYSIHFMFAKDNIVEYNRFYDNAVGVYFMYTEGGVLRHNLISHATGATGMAIGFKEASNTLIEGNEVIYCAIGIGSDLSPFQPDSKIWVKNNRFAFNGIAVQFTSELGGNVLTDNVFEGNLTNVVQAGRGKGDLNEWRGNFWDDYKGFDRDLNGTGDTPYELYAYADQIWIELPMARFFKTAPVLELLDFLERLAPFSSPELTLKDAAPKFVKPTWVLG
jgi:nitrous oxidase accessory protein